MRAMIIAALMLLSLMPAQADPDVHSANFRMPSCRKDIQNDYSDAFMSGTCSGSVDVMMQFGNAYFGICFPQGATIQQGVRVVVQYIDARPARMHENFLKLALEALRDAWPCKQGAQ